MRAAFALALSVVLALLVSGIALLECPFLTAEATTQRSHCPRPEESNHPPQCPYAPSLETCPYYSDDGELNFVEARFEAVVPATVGFLPEMEAPVTDFRPFDPSCEINDRNLHIPHSPLTATLRLLRSPTCPWSNRVERRNTMKIAIFALLLLGALGAGFAAEADCCDGSQCWNEGDGPQGPSLIRFGAASKVR
jgi:hypothetical protein